MDSLTHALVITIVLSLIGRPDLVPFGIAGAVLIDVDVIFSYFSDRDPKLYIFTHGGFTHSILGAFAVSMGVTILATLVALAGILPSFGLTAVAVILAGALSHIAIDYLAYPGIPLFYPMTDKKYTAGVMGGPNGYIMLGSVIFIALLLLGKASLEQSWAYMLFFLAIIGFCATAKCYAALNTRGRTVATMSPFKWLVIEEAPDKYHFYTFDFFHAADNGHIFEKYKGIDRLAAESYNRSPEMKRLRYHSYIVTVEKNADSITYRDPIREGNHIWYPPYYKHLTITDHR